MCNCKEGTQNDLGPNSFPGLAVSLIPNHQKAGFVLVNAQLSLNFLN